MSDTPTPIDPEDIRPGDVVRIAYEVTCERVDRHGIILASSGYSFNPHDDATWHLVSRPDPDAEAVEALAKLVYDISHPDADDLEASREALRDLREQGWDVVRRAES